MTEEQQTCDTPRLTEIAATIMAGLLASGEYTEGRTMEGENGYPGRTSVRYRPEVIAASVELAHHLVRAVEAHGPIKQVKPAETE